MPFLFYLILVVSTGGGVGGYWMYVFVKDNEETVIVTNLSSHLLVHSFDLLSLGVAPLHQNLYDGGLVHIYVMSSTVY